MLVDALQPIPDSETCRQDAAPKTIKLQTLTSSKAKLRAKLASCKSAQQECNFELTWAVLPPQDLKAISYTTMKVLVANVVSLIGACESKYALIGDSDGRSVAKGKAETQLAEIPEEAKDESNPSSPAAEVPDSIDESQLRGGSMKEEKKQKSERKSRKKLQTEKEANLEDIALVKPRKEIAFGDTELLKYLVSRIAKPLADLQEKIDRSIDVVTSSLVSFGRAIYWRPFQIYSSLDIDI